MTKRSVEFRQETAPTRRISTEMLACVYLSPTIPNLTWRVQTKSLIQSVNGAFLRSGVLCRQLEPRQEIDSHRVARGLHSLWWPRSCFGTWNSANLTSKIRQSPHHSKLDGRGLSQLRRVSLRKLKTKSVSLHGCTLRLCLSPLRKKSLSYLLSATSSLHCFAGYFTLSAHN